MAFENWKKENGEWCSSVVTVVAACGLLILAGLYYRVTHDPEIDLAATTRPATTTGSATR